MLNVTQFKTISINCNLNKKDSTRLSLILRYFDDFHGGDINSNTIDVYFLYLRNRKHKNKYISTLKGILKKAIINTMRSAMSSDVESMKLYGFGKSFWEDYFRSIIIKRSVRTIDRYNLPTPEEVYRMVEYEPNPVRGLLIAFTYSMGLRNSEVRNIKLTDIRKKTTTFNGHWVDEIVIISKNQNERVVPVRSDYIDYIIEIQQPLIWLFERLPGVQFSERTFQHLVKKNSRISIGKDVHPHLLRHSLATELYRVTKDIIGGSLFIGDRPKTFTETYVHTQQNKSVISVSDVDRIIEITKRKTG